MELRLLHLHLGLRERPGDRTGRQRLPQLLPYFPAGTVGDTRTVAASVSTSVPERTLANNSGSTTFTYALPPLGDLELYGIDVVGRQELRANEEFDLAVFVNLLGGSPSENVSVRVPLPATVEPTSLDPGDANWTCRLGDAAATASSNAPARPGTSGRSAANCCSS
ncbi:hypothetical protein NKG94_33960 [Micromonospora sp. M12]